MAPQLGNISTVWSWTAVKLGSLVTAGPVQRPEALAKVLPLPGGLTWVVSTSQNDLLSWLFWNSVPHADIQLSGFLDSWGLLTNIFPLCHRLSLDFFWLEHHCECWNWREEPQREAEHKCVCLVFLKILIHLFSLQPVPFTVNMVQWSAPDTLFLILQPWKPCVGQTLSCYLFFTFMFYH